MIGYFFHSVRRARLPVKLSVLLLHGVLGAAWAYAPPSEACAWDRDTLEMEKREFPSVEDAIFGKTTRRSKALYDWRIEDRRTILARNPHDVGALDDLIVAYDKTGQHDKAIKAARRSVRAHPNRYESLANYGTVLIHGGKYREGLKFLRRAVKINPDAHFGRESVQIHLVEIVVERMEKAGASSPPVPLFRGRGAIAQAFARRMSGKGAKGLTAEQRKEVVKGIVGMLHFGKHDSPILLEALADVLYWPTEGSRPKNTGDGSHAHLAVFAFYRAASVTEEPARSYYSGRAQELAERVRGFFGSAPAMPNYIEERQRKAEAWVDARHAKERAAIVEGRNPDDLH